MKQDPYFKYVAAALITAVLLAFFNPNAVAHRAQPDTVASTALTQSQAKS